MKKIYLTLIVILFFQIQGVNAQVEKKILSYNEFTKIDNSLKGSITTYLFLWAKGYYSAYLEFTTNVDQFFKFGEDEIVPKRIQSILLNNKKSFELKSNDSILVIYYNGVLLDSCQAPFDCLDISNVSDRRNMVKLFDNNGFSIWNEEIVKSFREEIIQIYEKFKKDGYKTVFPKKDTFYVVASCLPLVIAYEYDKKHGLSIHKICSVVHKLSENLYTKEIAELAEKYCKKYDLSKIIFSARVYKKEN